MRKILLTTATLVAAASAFAAFGSSPSQAANPEWCAYTSTTMTSNCAFNTLAQCKAFVSGMAGTCERSIAGVRNAQARYSVTASRVAALPNYWENESFTLGH